MRLLLGCAQGWKRRPVSCLVAAADVCTTVELILETMVVPIGKLSETDHLANILSDKIGSGCKRCHVDCGRAVREVTPPIKPRWASSSKDRLKSRVLLKLFVANSLQPTRRRVSVSRLINYTRRHLSRRAATVGSFFSVSPPRVPRKLCVRFSLFFERVFVFFPLRVDCKSNSR